MKKKKVFEYKTLDKINLILFFLTMPIIVFFLTDPLSVSSIGYLGLWFTIVTGFVFIHIKLRLYYDLIFGED